MSDTTIAYLTEMLYKSEQARTELEFQNDQLREQMNDLRARYTRLLDLPANTENDATAKAIALEFMRAGRSMIDAIREYRAREDAPLKEAKNAIEQFWVK